MLVRTCTATGTEDKPFPILYAHGALSADVAAPLAKICDMEPARALRRESHGWNLADNPDRYLVPGAMKRIARRSGHEFSARIEQPATALIHGEAPMRWPFGAGRPG